jgi:hypothetical protein
MTIDLDEFTSAYVECALWSSNDKSDDSGGEPLDKNYTVEDIAPETLQRMIEDCRAFRDDAKIMACILSGAGEKHAGHDFWLTRNGHGAGFWDGDWEEPDSDYLESQCAKFGEFDLYIGDDGLIHGFPL